jgi:CRISPR-associated protein Cmr5
MPEEQSKAVNQDQARALQAWTHIGDPANAERVKIKDYSGDYKSLVKSFPAMILTNGIGQALAFLRAKGKYGQPDENKGKPQHRALYKHISLWVTKEIYDGQPTDQLMQEIIQGTSDKYRRATTETLAFVAWLKRFAEAEIEREGTDS